MEWEPDDDNLLMSIAPQYKRRRLSNGKLQSHCTLWAHLVEDASFTNWAAGSPQEGANLADCAMLRADQVMHKIYIVIMHDTINIIPLIQYTKTHCTVIHHESLHC